MRFGQDDKRIIDFVENVCRDLGLTEEIKRRTNEDFLFIDKTRRRVWVVGSFESSR